MNASNWCVLFSQVPVGLYAIDRLEEDLELA